MSPIRILAALVVALAGAVAPAGAATKQPEKPSGATVFAAASLGDVFKALAPKNTFNFAGSDQLSFQISQGAPADVFASANTKYTSDLYNKGIVFRPHVFATNTLVVIVPKSNPARIRSVYDIVNPGIKLVIGDQSVPIGSYTRSVFTRLGIAADALKNVVSNEADVKAVAGKVALGEADAGVVYITDVRSIKRFVTAIPIPDSAQPTVRYEVAVVKSAKHRKEAQAFVRWLLTKPGRRYLEAFGFGLPARL
jgi:molybdate transport system substrate-binding protein